MRAVTIDAKRVGPGNPCYIVAELGINAAGSMDVARTMIDVAAECGVDAVKFQKRTVEAVYPEEALLAPRRSPFGTTNGDLKRGLEFSVSEMATLGKYAIAKGLNWGASCWDEFSVADLAVKCITRPTFLKIASPGLTHNGILVSCATIKNVDRIPLLVSTGMSTGPEVDAALDILGRDHVVLMHCVSAYPPATQDLNLSVMNLLSSMYDIPVGYSGHEDGLDASLCAVAMGACCIERHFTLDKRMWGSDQAMSLNPEEMASLVSRIREFEIARGHPEKRVYPCEESAKAKLRR